MPADRPPALAPGDVEDLVRAVLQRAPGPMSAVQVHRDLPRAGRPPRNQVVAMLGEMAREGAVHAWPGGRSSLFWTRTPEDAVREGVTKALDAGPQSEAALRRAVGRALAPMVKGALARLVTGGMAYLHPPLGRTKTPLYGLAPPDPLRYLAPSLDEVVAEGRKRGFAEEQVRAAIARYAAAGEPRPAEESPGAGAGADEAAVVRAAILQLNPRAAEGALVYVPHLRVALGSRFPDKPSFDRSLLGLLATGRIQLQAHPVPSQLNAEEKEAMVPDGRGSYYMAVGLVTP